AARLLDQTSEDLQDLEVARTLQETFYPSSGVSVGEWRIWGRSRFAGSVGGDYVDFFKVSEQQAILIIGDVSGHGIGAALVVAMARAAFAHPAVQGNPQRMMESLNTLFVRTLKRRKMMSCCLAFVDAEQRTVTMVNAGHQWPLLVRNQRAEFLPTQGFPVGAARNWSAGSRTLEVASDDVLFWYSDGLVEALDRQGISLGYKRLQDDLPSLCGNTPEETEGNVWRWFARLSPADPPEDDVSVLILQHQVVVGPRPGEVA
ncbi:MAG TPA: PP2C family protein-serine/threonine phosphatase, partial [Candidatus Ozemobacteraceae bacterium]|nr:PP2C family protein-serine/threonine phosphatase [Candidatus Ozemobacteraceae bacterium]